MKFKTIFFSATILQKVIIITFAGLLLLSTILIIVSFNSMNTLIENVSRIIFFDNLRNELKSVHVYLHDHYGDLSLVDKTLVDSSGSPIETNFELVDSIKNELNIEVSIFVKYGLDYKRNSSTIRDDEGERIIGTTLGFDNPALPKVSFGHDFIEMFYYLGVKYFGGYTPIIDVNRDIIGLIFIGVTHESVYSSINNYISTSQRHLVVIYIIFVTLMSFLMFFCFSFILSPIKKTINILIDKLAGNNELTSQLPINTNDEMGVLAAKLNFLLHKINEVVTTIVTNTKNLQSKSIGLSAISEKLISNAKEMNVKSLFVTASTEFLSEKTNAFNASTVESSISVSDVASAAELLSSQLKQVAESSEIAKTDIISLIENIETLDQDIESTCFSVESMVGDIFRISSATNIMSKRVSKVSEKTQLAFDISQQVNTDAKVYNQFMQDLHTLSKDVNQSTKSINSNLLQTNAIILNAIKKYSNTCDEGKAFSQTLNEIMNLSKQNLSCADNITNHFEKLDMLNKSSNMVLNNINATIKKLNELATSIEIDIYEQNKTTSEIKTATGNIAKVAHKVKSEITCIHNYSKTVSVLSNDITISLNEISSRSIVSTLTAKEIADKVLLANTQVNNIYSNTVEISHFIHEVSKNIAEMIPQIESTTNYAKNTKIASDDLYKIAEELNTKVGLFKI